MDTTYTGRGELLKELSSVKWVQCLPYRAPKSRLHEITDLTFTACCLVPRTKCEHLPLPLSFCCFLVLT